MSCSTWDLRLHFIARKLWGIQFCHELDINPDLKSYQSYPAESYPKNLNVDKCHRTACFLEQLERVLLLSSMGLTWLKISALSTDFSTKASIQQSIHGSLWQWRISHLDLCWVLALPLFRLKEHTTKEPRIREMKVTSEWNWSHFTE